MNLDTFCQVFDFRTFTWSALNPTRDSNQLNLENNATGGSFPALAGHSLVKWKNNLVVVAGNTRSLSSSNKVSGICSGKPSNFRNKKKKNLEHKTCHHKFA